MAAQTRIFRSSTHFFRNCRALPGKGAGVRSLPFIALLVLAVASFAAERTVLFEEFTSTG